MKHEKAQNWLRVNHDPSMGVNNIRNMCKAIGYEHVQVNTIRVIAGTKNQEKSESPKSEKSSPLGNKQRRAGGNRRHQARQETITTGEIPLEKASSPYEVIQIEAKDRQMSAIIIYDTGSEFSLCNQDTKFLATYTKKDRRNLAISTINNVQN